jgi:hypothetical protein
MLSWLKKKYAEYKASCARSLELANAPRLHGVNLGVYNYLGRSEIHFEYTDAEYKDHASVFFFANKKDNDKRKYVIVPTQSHMLPRFQSHPWIVKNAELWLVGERSLYDVVRDEPSTFLKDYIAENFDGEVWSNETKWWVSSDKIKYNKAKAKQDKKKEKLTEENNVVKLEFKKNDEKKE